MQHFTAANLPVNLRNRPTEVQELFISTANEAKAQGSNFTQAVALANKIANELDAKLQSELLAKQKPTADVKQVLKQGLVQRHKQQLLNALDYINEIGDVDTEEQDTTEVVKAQVLPSKTVKSTEFDKQGRLVTILDDGTRVISKNAAPADNINQSVAVQVNPVFDYVRFNTTADTPVHEEGLLFYDDQDYSLVYYNENQNVSVNLGREELIRVYNNNSHALVDGDVVYINGATNGWPTVYRANASSKQTSSSTIGLVTAPIAVGDYGYVCVSGVVRDVDTSMYTEGTVLYLDTLLGKVTDVPPLQPNYVVEVATVLNSSSTAGKLYVRVDKQEWHPSVILLDPSASITLPTTPTVFKPSTTNYNDGFIYDSATGILELTQSSSYAVSIQFNAIPSASNKNLYFYVEEQPLNGSWTIGKYTARKLELVNAQETQLTITAARYYPVGTKIRFYIWSDSTVNLVSTDLPGTAPGTVTLPAFRLMFAG